MLLDSMPELQRYVGIDVPVGYAPAKEIQRKEVPAYPGQFALEDPRFRLLIAGRGSHDLYPEDIGLVDVAFIDGDHSMKGVTKDFALANACVRKGGVIVFHDYHDLGTVDVAAALEELVATAHLDIKHVEGTWLAFMRT